MAEPRPSWLPPVLRVVRTCPACGESEPRASGGVCLTCRLMRRWAERQMRTVMQAWAVMHGGWRNG